MIDDDELREADVTTLLVGVNIKFDLLHALREPQNLDAWMEFVARGGNVWDCQLAEYLLRGMEPTSHMLSMDEMVVSYGGNVKIDEVRRASRHSTRCGVLKSASGIAASFGKSRMNADRRSRSLSALAFFGDTSRTYLLNASSTVYSSGAGLF
ncbi:hypothetical protein X947_5087 [Burkholderia pseudomallei MSHR7334]|nr:hypothetical protein X947_5087 [Burkholderia pseudomallei MSHR7334]